MTLGGVAYIVASVLAAVFVVAAVSKLRDLLVVEQQFEAMGLRRPYLMARLVPGSEIGIAALLVLDPPVGAAVAFVALVAMTVVLLRLLRSGVTTYCACFGAASTTAALSWREIARNAVLIAMAVLALYAERGSPFS